MADPPATPADLTVHHLERYWFQRRAEIKQRGLHHEVWAVRSVLEQMPPGVIAEDVDAWLHRRLPAGEIPTVPGYSDREFDAIMAAARSEVAAIRTRLKHGQLLLDALCARTRFVEQRGPSASSGAGRHRGHRRGACDAASRGKPGTTIL